MTGVDYGRARELGAATIHEAAGRIGSLPASIRPVAPPMRAAGPAFTAQCRPGDNLWIHRALYAAPPGAVLVVATGAAAPEWGYWGEILSHAAVARALGGVVLEGGSRDTDELASIGFPVFSLGSCIRGTVKDSTSPYGGIDRPVVIGDVVVASGDLVVADHDGVVVVPGAGAADAVRAGEARVDKERQVIAQLRDGATTLALYHLGE